MSKLYPSAYQIDYQKEYNNGVRGVLFDVDNTLVRHGEPATKQAKELFEHLRSIGLKTCIISNNKEPRVSPFAKEVGSDYIYKAGKPSVRGYEEAMKRIHTTPDTTIFIGDQIFTDIYGGSVNQQVTTIVLESKKEIPIISSMNLPIIMSVALSDEKVTLEYVESLMEECQPKFVTFEQQEQGDEEDEFFD